MLADGDGSDYQSLNNDCWSIVTERNIKRMKATRAIDSYICYQIGPDIFPKSKII